VLLIYIIYIHYYNSQLFEFCHIFNGLFSVPSIMWSRSGCENCNSVQQNLAPLAG